MTEPQQPLPLTEVLAIVDRRRRRRARVKTVAGSALGVAAAGAASLIVVAVRPQPAALVPAAAPPSSVSSPTLSSRPPDPTTSAPPPFDAGYLEPDYLDQLADSILTGGSDPDDVRKVDDAYALSEAWGVELYPAAKAIAAKAALTGTAIDPEDPSGDDKLVSRFEQAGYTDAYAAVLAKAWATDTRTAKIVGALVIDAGCCGG